MIQKTTFLAAGLAGVLLAGIALADPSESELVIDGQKIETSAPAPAFLDGALGHTIYSGWRFRTPETQALETDDFENPAMVLVETAVANWSTVDGAAGKSCESCHGDVAGFKGLAPHMPKVDKDGKLVVMEDLINKCRTDRMQAKAWSWNSNDLQSMVAYIRNQSRGMPVDVAIDGPAKPFWEKGKEMYYTRYGQLELSCASCHELNFGKHIRADHLSQGQINGFPTYRLKQAALISVHNRFKGCIRDTRAETYKEGSDEFRALELYVASRGNGLDVETPAVRQ
jgi:sulfur-oxidizing protein SoxA